MYVQSICKLTLTIDSHIYGFNTFTQFI